jgi:hypothetical protein
MTQEPPTRDLNLERLIERRGADVLRMKENAGKAADLAARWTYEARRAAADVAALVALRTPQTVARMEAEKGLL